MLSAEEILRIPITDPGKLFSHDPVIMEATYHKLAQRWHPDKPGGSNEVFAHISVLHGAAKTGNWNNSKSLEFIDKRGTHYNLKYKVMHQFELGHVYIGSRIVAWQIDHKYEDFVLNGQRAISNIRYPDSKIKDQHQRYIPVIQQIVETEVSYFIIMNKTEDMILLSDLIKHLGRIPPKHMAWMVSSLLNILSFYEIIGLTHNGLDVNTVFVSPVNHAAFPLGGWWYALKTKEKLKYLSPTSFLVAPTEVLLKKVADARIDLASVRAIARTAISDPTGARLQSTDDIPKSLANWLRLPPPHNAIKDYENWGKVLTESWGPRKFLKLDVDINSIY